MVGEPQYGFKPCEPPPSVSLGEQPEPIRDRAIEPRGTMASPGCEGDPIVVKTHFLVMDVILRRSKRPTPTVVARHQVEHELAIMRSFEGLHGPACHREREQLVPVTARVPGAFSGETSLSRVARWESRLREQLWLHRKSNFVAADEPSLEPRICLANIVQPASERQILNDVFGKPEPTSKLRSARLNVRTVLGERDLRGSERAVVVLRDEVVHLRLKRAYDRCREHDRRPCANRSHACAPEFIPLLS